MVPYYWPGWPYMRPDGPHTHILEHAHVHSCSRAQVCPRADEGKRAICLPQPSPILWITMAARQPINAASHNQQVFHGTRTPHLQEQAPVDFSESDCGHIDQRSREAAVVHEHVISLGEIEAWADAAVSVPGWQAKVDLMLGFRAFVNQAHEQDPQRWRSYIQYITDAAGRRCLGRGGAGDVADLDSQVDVERAFVEQ